jgi:hypothetical protein
LTATDARKSLKEMAVRAHVKTGRAKMTIRLIQDEFEHRCTFKIAGLKCEVYANPSFLYVIVHRESTVFFATPRRSSIASTGLLLGQVAGRDVFVNTNGRGSPVPWIERPEAITALSSLGLESDELLTVALNGPHALLRSAGPDADWERLQKLVALAGLLPQAATRRSHPPVLTS